MAMTRWHHPLATWSHSPSSTSGGFASPPHQFLYGLLDYYKIELKHLNQNGIQHQAAFVMLCEGYLGINAHFDLWRHFFAITLLKVKRKNGELDHF
jgi:hypothetical protein